MLVTGISAFNTSICHLQANAFHLWIPPFIIHVITLIISPSNVSWPRSECFNIFSESRVEIAVPDKDKGALQIFFSKPFGILHK